jgi:hypothetical protein
MHFSWKRWRLVLIAALTALAVSVTFAGPAFAAEPGEWGSWNAEMVNNQNLQVASQGTLSEARNDGNLLEVWRGADNNQVWMSLNNEDAFTIGTTATNVSPTVVAWGEDSFMVFHTGVDSNIYYTVVYGDGGYEGQWFAVPNQTTNMPVSVTQVGEGGNNLYMVYRGVGDDRRVWGTYFNNGLGEWQYIDNIGGGLSNSAPSVAYNPEAAALTVVVRGDDNAVWMNSGWLNDWSSWTSEGSTTIDTPHIGVSSTGNMIVDALASDYTTQYRIYDRWGENLTEWQPDTTYWQSHYPVQLAAYGAAIYAIITGLNGNLVYYKEAYNGQ